MPTSDEVKIQGVSGLPLRPYLDDIWAHLGVIDSEITDLQNNGGGGGVDQDLFSEIDVSGQDTVTADSPTTALTFIAGNNMVITTDNTAKSITFTPGGSPNIDGGFADSVYYATLVDGGGA